jgi:hypothetical protein
MPHSGKIMTVRAETHTVSNTSTASDREATPNPMGKPGGGSPSRQVIVIVPLVFIAPTGLLDRLVFSAPPTGLLVPLGFSALQTGRLVSRHLKDRPTPGTLRFPAGAPAGSFQAAVATRTSDNDNGLGTHLTSLR